jgi:hypothetical protein
MTLRRYRTAAVLLPIGAVLVFMPPYIRILDRPDFVWGIPVLHLAFFALWLLGIVLTAVVARRLSHHMAAEEREPDNGQGRH